MKKISICGKGGCGKSAVTTLLAEGLQKRGYEALVVDSDESNPGLYRMLGFEGPPGSLMELIGGRKGVREILKPDEFGQGEDAEPVLLARPVITLSDIPDEYMRRREGIRLVTVGKIVEAGEGCACVMGSMTKRFLERLQLEENQVVLVDMEAGVEHFGRGVDTSLDGILVVIEPSFESLLIAEKIHEMAQSIDIGEVWAVLNRVESEDIADTLREQLEKRDIPVIGTIRMDRELLQANLAGKRLFGHQASEDVEKILDALLF